MRLRRTGFLLHRLLQNRTLYFCAFTIVTAALVAARWQERRVSAQTASPSITVTTTQLGISPGAPTAAESTDPLPAPAGEPEPSAQPARAAVPAGSRTPLAENSENLLKLANSLKTDVDKTTKDMLSVNVVREAGQIEQLAHKMRTQ